MQNSEKRFPGRRPNKYKTISMSISVAEYDKIKARAERQGLTVSAWLKQAIMDRIQWENENA